MPEGDVVWNTAKRLHTALAGQVLTRSDFRVPRYATVSLTGRLVTEAVSRGKHLLIRTDNGLTVHTHLKMEGYWRVQPVGSGRPGGRSHQLRLVLGNAEWLAAGYLLGITEVLPTAQEDRVVGHLGPDLLGADGTRRPPPGGSPATRTGPSARHCLTSGTCQASGRSTCQRRCSCVASTRGAPSGRSPVTTFLGWSNSGTGCSTPTRNAPGT